MTRHPTDEPQSKQHCFTVDEADAKSRLDHFLSRQVIDPDNGTGLTRSQIKRLIETGHVTVGGETARPAKKLKAGESIRLVIPPPDPIDLIPEPIPLDIYYEDEHLVVINKQRGLVVHPAPGHACGTLVNALLFSHGLDGGDPLRPGIVHRLDKDTSGLMVVAKRVEAHAALAVQFHAHTVDRRYRVLVLGNPPPEGVWHTLHGRSPTDRRRFTTKVSRGKEAKSRFRVRERFQGACELEVALQTGRTHQVRVHCYDHGFPVLGDPLYPPKHLSSALREIHNALDGQALHAELLGFDHPVSGERLRFESPPPDAYRFALDALKSLV